MAQPLPHPSPTSGNSDWAGVVATPFGRMGIRSNATAVTELCFLPPDAPLQAPRDALAEHTAAAIAHWFEHPSIDPPFPTTLHATPFQQRVWQAIRSIPPGETRTYGELAQALGSSPRAVGNACGRNPLPLFTPCHRVVAVHGLGGFSRAGGGYLLDIKRWLLAREAV